MPQHTHSYPHPLFWPLCWIPLETSASYLTCQPQIMFHPAPMISGFLSSLKSCCWVQVLCLGMLILIPTPYVLDLIRDLTFGSHTSALVGIPLSSHGPRLPIKPEISLSSTDSVSQHTHSYPHSLFWHIYWMSLEMSTSHLTHQPWLVSHPAPMVLGLPVEPKISLSGAGPMPWDGMLILIPTSDFNPQCAQHHLHISRSMPHTPAGCRKAWVLKAPLAIPLGSKPKLL
jgi:hypothetical protein